MVFEESRGDRTRTLGQKMVSYQNAKDVNIGGVYRYHGGRKMSGKLREFIPKSLVR